MKFNSTFPLRHYINLGRRQDRRLETEERLKEAGITAERFPAVDARFVRRNRGYESAGRCALALSQRLVLRNAALEKADAVLVMEDDVIFHTEFLQRIEEIELPEDWGIFYLGCAHRERPEPDGPGLVRVRYALDTHAFAVRAPYYRQVIAALGRREGEDCPHAKASDWFLADLHGEIPTYACYPNLAWQAVNRSELVGLTYSNYTSSGEQRASAGQLTGLQAEMWGGKRWSKRVIATESEEDPGMHAAGNGTIPIPPKVDRQEPKLGMLFLTRGDVSHPEIWREFTEEARDGVRVLSHAKDRGAAERGFLAGTGLEEQHETKWGDISLVWAMLALLRAGLSDETLTHFAFASESCVPVKPWGEIRRRLQIDPRPMMYFDDVASMKPQHRKRLQTVRDLPHRCWRAHSQWMLLDREVVECILEDDLSEHFAGILAPDEHYFGSLLALRGFPDWRKINRQDVTWVKWNEKTRRPVEPMRSGPLLAAELAAFPGFFARKFPPGSDIAKWGLHRS